MTKRRLIAITGMLVLNLQGRAFAGDTHVSVFVALELRQGGQWEVIDSRSVLSAGDEIRFRFRASVAGFLRVLNVSSEGQMSWLFPLDQDHSSQVLPGRDYRVPLSDGSFIVGGNPGFDTTYWLIGPVPGELQKNKSDVAQGNTLLPRCHEGILRARGLCLDGRAGPRAVLQKDPVPLAISEDGQLSGRDLEFQRAGDSVHILAKQPQTGVLMYEFRVAHH